METKIDFVKLWADSLVELETNMLSTTYKPWIEPLVPHYFENDTLVLLSGHSFAVQQLSNPDNAKKIRNALSNILGRNADFKIVYDEELSKKLKKAYAKSQPEQMQSTAPTSAPTQPASKYDNLKQMYSSCNLNLKYKFQNFVVGENNNFAYNAAQGVSQTPIDNEYNPLFIYGASGLGKTHLMQAIGHHILFNHPTLKVKYLKANDFLQAVVNATSLGAPAERTAQINKVRQKFKNIDVLLIDDIQIIAGKPLTENEIFAIFDDLHVKGKQVIITNDKPPKEIHKLSDRLKTRFEWGLLAEMTAPDLPTRIKILEKLAKDNNIRFSTDITEFLAEVYSNNVRELEGAFNNIKAHIKFNRIQNLSLDNVKSIIGYKSSVKTITPSDVVGVLSDYFNVSEKDILGKSRSKNINNIRQIAIYLTIQMTKYSLSDVGKFFDKTHTTIMYSRDKMVESLTTDTKLKSIVDELTLLIRQ